MCADHPDAELLNDFLTESGELIEQLDADLVRLEEQPADKELLDKIFRALHTIKGAASFLNLGNLTRFAHAAEDALNKLRKGEASVDATVIDALLRSVDVLRRMLDAIAHEREIEQGPAELVQTLHAIAAGSESATPASAQASAAARATPAGVPAPLVLPTGASAPVCALRERPLVLAPEKADLLTYMTADLHETAQRMSPLVAALCDSSPTDDTTRAVVECAATLHATSDYFALKPLGEIVDLIDTAASRLDQIEAQSRAEAGVRVRALLLLLEQFAEGLEHGVERVWPLDTLSERLASLICGQPIDPSIAGAHENDPHRVLEVDGVASSAAPQLAQPGAIAAADSQPAPVPIASTGPAPSAASTPAPFAAPSTKGDEPARAPGAQERTGGSSGAGEGSIAEQTVRVEVTRLETLLNLVGELVLMKNQIIGISRQVRAHPLPHELQESMNGAVGGLDRLTSELQVGVMRTRMQPLAKLFGRYPRVIRDVARSTGKQIDLLISGGETEVDKSVLELLGDPLVHMLRNSADHGVETPEVRTAAGKPALGTIRLSAEHQGGHVRVEIADDGKGIDAQRVLAKAVERGLVSPEQGDAMPESEVLRLIFAPGLSTADKVSDLSGRGVGMDVVKTNIEKLGGTVNVSSVKGKGTTFEILIPLTVAIMPAMMVLIGRAEYAVPIASIVEIVRLDEKQVHSVAGAPVMRLRDLVLPLIDMRRRLHEPDDNAPPSRFAVVVSVGQQRAGLMVDRLVGQQEVVIKPLDDTNTSGGPFSGATIREDGGVSLILDVIALLRDAAAHAQPVAA